MGHKYKLVYFNARGRAEISRLLFAAAGVEYEDERIESEDWAKMKSKMPQGTVPVLVIDGETTVSQSMAIARYLAKEFNFFGQTTLEYLYVEQFMETAIEMASKFNEVFAESDQKKKQEILTKFQTEVLQRSLGFLENLVSSFGSNGFAVGNSYTLADFYFMALVDFVGCSKELEKHPNLAAVLKKVREHPRLSKYLQNRPVTQF